MSSPPVPVPRGGFRSSIFTRSVGSILDVSDAVKPPSKSIASSSSSSSSTAPPSSAVSLATSHLLNPRALPEIHELFLFFSSPDPTLPSSPSSPRLITWRSLQRIFHRLRLLLSTADCKLLLQPYSSNVVLAALPNQDKNLLYSLTLTDFINFYYEIRKSYPTLNDELSLIFSFFDDEFTGGIDRKIFRKTLIGIEMEDITQGNTNHHEEYYKVIRGKDRDNNNNNNNDQNSRESEMLSIVIKKDGGQEEEKVNDHYENDEKESAENNNNENAPLVAPSSSLSSSSSSPLSSVPLDPSADPYPIASRRVDDMLTEFWPNFFEEINEPIPYDDFIEFWHS